MEHNYIGGKTRDSFNEFEELFKGVEAFMGYVPNAHLAMAERPELLFLYLNNADFRHNLISLLFSLLLYPLSQHHVKYELGNIYNQKIDLKLKQLIA